MACGAVNPVMEKPEMPKKTVTVALKFTPDERRKRAEMLLGDAAAVLNQLTEKVRDLGGRVSGRATHDDKGLVSIRFDVEWPHDDLEDMIG